MLGSALRLVLEASTPHASVAVLRGGEVLAEGHAEMRPGADETLMPAVDRVLRGARVQPSELSAVVCGAGPGGFTSLRIAAAIAKGLAHATGCTLETVPSLALAGAARGPGAWLVTLDALRGEQYAARVQVGNDQHVAEYAYLGVRSVEALGAEVRRMPGEAVVDANARAPRAADLPSCARLLTVADLDAWEPLYGRLAEAQARWEVAHGRPLASVVAHDTPA